MAATEEDADFVIGPVTLVDANLLAFALRDVDQLRGDGHASGLLEQRAQAAAKRAAGDVGPAVGVLYDRIIGAADFEGAFARSDVETGLAVHLAFENQLADQFEFCLCCMSAHGVLLPYVVVSRYSL